MRRYSLWLTILVLVLILMLASACGDCVWSAQGKAWLDLNQNGVWDADEQPLQNIKFYVDDVSNQSVKVATSLTDEEGNAQIFLGLTSCPKIDREVYSEAPSDYRLTTARRMPTDSSRTDEVFQSGYYYTPLAPPTPAPSPAPIACHRFSIPYFDSYWLPIAFSDDGNAWTTAESHGRRIIELDAADYAVKEYSRDEDFLGFAAIYDMALAPDGAIWLTTMSGVSRFDTVNWTSFIVDNGMKAGNAQDIAILPSNDVPVETDAGIEVLDPATITWYVVLSQEELGYREATRFRQLGDEVFHIASDRILRFWKDEADSRVQWDVLWQTGSSPSQSPRLIADADFASNKELWLAGIDEESRPVVVDRSLDTNDSVVYSYGSTGGAIGQSVIGGIQIAQDGSIWLDEYNALVHGTPAIEDHSIMEWVRYDVASLVEEHDSPIISKIAAAPDGAIWFTTRYSWNRCTVNAGSN